MQTGKRIKCDFYDYESKSWNQYEIDLNMNIYPCCFYYLNEVTPKDKIKDKTIDHIDNSLKTNKLQNIINEFNKSFNEKVWNSKECPPLCIKKCEITENGS